MEEEVKELDGEESEDKKEKKYCEKQNCNKKKAKEQCAKFCGACGQAGLMEEEVKELDGEDEETNDLKQAPMMCAQDVEECEDGSSVGRDPYNNCDFKPCPDVQKGKSKKCEDKKEKKYCEKQNCNKKK